MQVKSVSGQRSVVGGQWSDAAMLGYACCRRTGNVPICCPSSADASSPLPSTRPPMIGQADDLRADIRFAEPYQP